MALTGAEVMAVMENLIKWFSDHRKGFEYHVMVLDSFDWSQATVKHNAADQRVLEVPFKHTM
jgi:hypothetical protein